jgi:hypothetical protein
MFDSGMDIDGSSASGGASPFGHGGGVPMDDILRMFMQQNGRGGMGGFSGFGGMNGGGFSMYEDEEEDDGYYHSHSHGHPGFSYHFG